MQHIFILYDYLSENFERYSFKREKPLNNVKDGRVNSGKKRDVLKKINAVKHKRKCQVHG